MSNKIKTLKSKVSKDIWENSSESSQVSEEIFEENSEEFSEETCKDIRKGKRARFIIDKCLRYLWIVVRESSIPKAGRGAFTLSFIPKDAYTLYRGVPKDKKSANMDYSWEISTYDKDGSANHKRVLFYSDASEEGPHTNFTRFVNCGLRKSQNNMKAVQYKKTMRYVATRDIQIGEELFCDYGKSYRKHNLGMRDTY